MDDPNVKQRAEEIALAILTAPGSETISTIKNLLNERIPSHSRDERGEPDQRVVSMWLEELSMRVTVYRRDFNHGRAESARGALTAMIAHLLTDL